MTTTLSLFDSLESDRRQKIDWRPSNPPSLDGIDEIFLDAETTGLRWWENDRPVGFALRVPDGRSWYLPFAHRGGGNLDEVVVRRWFEREVRGKRITNLNSRFDNHMAYVWGVDLEAQNCTWSDVAHYAALLDDSMRRGFSLEALSKRYLGIDEAKVKTTPSGERIDPSRMAEYHASEIELYARRDVELVHRLKEVMWPELDRQDLQRVRALEDDVIFVTCEMERNGAPIDVELLDEWCSQAEAEVVDRLYKIKELSGFKLSTPDSRKDLTKIWNELGLPTSKLTDKGQISFDEEALQEIDHPIVREILEARYVAHVESKYLRPYRRAVGEDGLLHYALHQLRSDEAGTISGRYSAEKIQIVPGVEAQLERFGGRYLIRQLFIAEKGASFFSADAKQIEYRLFAHYAANPKVLEAYRLNPEMSYHNLVWKWVKPFKEDINYKSVKNLNFAQIYGAGKEKTAKMLGMSIAESLPFVRYYHKKIPEARTLSTRAMNVAERRGYVKSLLGRRTRFPDGKRIHKALNSVIQPSAADLLKMKMVEVHRENKRRKLGAKLRLTVHDELCGDTPDESTAKEIQTILNRQSIELKVPILWDMVVAENWAECELKSKPELDKMRCRDIPNVGDRTRHGR